MVVLAGPIDRELSRRPIQSRPQSIDHPRHRQSYGHKEGLAHRRVCIYRYALTQVAGGPVVGFMWRAYLVAGRASKRLATRRRLL